jgi:hypothetical protein
MSVRLAALAISVDAQAVADYLEHREPVGELRYEKGRSR